MLQFFNYRIRVYGGVWFYAELSVIERDRKLTIHIGKGTVVSEIFIDAEVYEWFHGVFFFQNLDPPPYVSADGEQLGNRAFSATLRSHKYREWEYLDVQIGYRTEILNYKPFLLHCCKAFVEVSIMVQSYLFFLNVQQSRVLQILSVGFQGG